MCTNGNCRNTIGSFECVCNPGYELDDRGLNCTGNFECLSLNIFFL